MMAPSSWNRIDWLRAFSSDMWLTPKNWLSPKRTRSMACAASGAAEGFMRSAEDARQQARAGRRLRRHRRASGLAEHHRDDAVGVQGRGEGIDAVHAACLDAGGEVVDLRRVLLAAQVEPDLIGEIGGVAHRPAGADTGQGGMRLAQRELALLTVRSDPAIGAPDA